MNMLTRVIGITIAGFFTIPCSADNTPADPVRISNTNHLYGMLAFYHSNGQYEVMPDIYATCGFKDIGTWHYTAEDFIDKPSGDPVVVAKTGDILTIDVTIGYITGAEVDFWCDDKSVYAATVKTFSSDDMGKVRSPDIPVAMTTGNPNVTWDEGLKNSVVLVNGELHPLRLNLTNSTETSFQIAQEYQVPLGTVAEPENLNATFHWNGSDLNGHKWNNQDFSVQVVTTTNAVISDGVLPTQSEHDLSWGEWQVTGVAVAAPTVSVACKYAGAINQNLFDESIYRDHVWVADLDKTYHSATAKGKVGSGNTFQLLRHERGPQPAGDYTETCTLTVSET